jgi:hypothetical protein
MAALLLERHPWETSGAEHQVQIPKGAFAQFFGAAGPLDVRVWVPPTAPAGVVHPLLLSYYEASDTYRFNWITEFGALGHAILVFDETGDPGVPYDVWWFIGNDVATALARPHGWQQAKGNQHGPGRMWAVVPSPASRIP